jgi:uncharacterized surface protein with fasciclin (FAS1) repeats
MKLKFTYLTLIAALFAGTTMAQTTKQVDESYSVLNRIKGYSANDAKAVDATLTTNGYNPGETLDISFSLTLTNTDAEYGDAISITFPAGFTINSVSNDDVFGPSFDDPVGTDGDPEPYIGIDGQTVSWGDDDNIYGGITPGNTYTFSINVTVDGSVSGEQTGTYEVSGDGFGADPADFSGTFTMEEGQPVTIFSIVAGSDVHTTLETALIESGLDAVLNDTEVDLTLFAPTDAAFDALPAGLLDELLDDATGALANVLLYHVLGEGLLDSELETIEITLQGETVTIGSDGTNATVNDVVISTTNLEADNGVVHIIDAVLVPEFCTVTAAGPYNDFTTAFDGAPVADNGICPFNSIFDAFPEDPFQGFASESYIAAGCTEGTVYTFGLSGGAIGAWEPSFIITDAVTGEIIASETEGNSITWECPADGDYIWIIHEEGFCGGQSDNTGNDNGYPFMTCESSLTITDIVVNSDVHETLEDAVIAAELDGILAGEGPYTVFAPTDAAFDNLPAGLLDELLADPTGDLTSILTHHVANGVVYSTDLMDGQSIPTLEGTDVTISINGNVVTVTSADGVVAEVTVTDIIASNGVVHVIDEVLIPVLSSVDNLTSVDDLRVFPNPTNNQFTLDIELTQTENVTVDLVNIVGQVVKTIDLGTRSAGLNREYIDVNDISEGIYFMNLTVGGTQGTVKVQVVR